MLLKTLENKNDAQNVIESAASNVDVTEAPVVSESAASKVDS